MPTMSNEKKVVLGEHEGHEIAFQKGSNRFTVSGPLFEGDVHWADSWREAVERIDRAKAVRRKAKRTVLNLEVLTDDGTPTAIKGVHAKQGNLLFTDGKLSVKAGGYDGVQAFPNVAWIKTALERRRVLNAELREITKTLRGYAIAPERVYGMSEANYDHIVDKLKKTHAEKVAKAKAHRVEVAAP